MRVTSPTKLGEAVVRNMTRLREARGWTKTDLVRRLDAAGWPMTTVLPIDRLAKGSRVLTVDELAIVARVFDVDPWSLTEPPHCDACLGSPPSGFTCNDCGARR